MKFYLLTLQAKCIPVEVWGSIRYFHSNQDFFIIFNISSCETECELNTADIWNKNNLQSINKFTKFAKISMPVQRTVISFQIFSNIGDPSNTFFLGSSGTLLLLFFSQFATNFCTSFAPENKNSTLSKLGGTCCYKINNMQFSKKKHPKTSRIFWAYYITTESSRVGRNHNCQAHIYACLMKRKFWL